MSIYLKDLYTDIIEELGVGTGSTKLNAAFIRATNRALANLENKADTGTDFNLVSRSDDVITQLSDKHDYILYSGIFFWLQRMGFGHGDARVAAATLADTRLLWRDAIGDYIKDSVNDAQDTGGEDIIAMGDLS